MHIVLCHFVELSGLMGFVSVISVGVCAFDCFVWSVHGLLIDSSQTGDGRSSCLVVFPMMGLTRSLYSSERQRM